MKSQKFNQSFEDFCFYLFLFKKRVKPANVNTMYLYVNYHNYDMLKLKFQIALILLPRLIIMILIYLQIDILVHTCNLSTTNSRKELWLIRLMYLNTQINPWIYVIMRKESVRRCFVMVSLCWRRVCNRENHQTQENDQDSGFFQ